MAKMLSIDVVPEGGGAVEVTHIFYGASEAAARAVFARHADGCEFLTRAIAEGRVEEEIDTIDDDDIPNYTDEPADGEDAGDDEEDLEED